MTLVERINKDMIDAMKQGQKERLTVIRTVKAGMQQEHIDKKRELDDTLVIDVVSKQMKMRQDSIREFEKAGRMDLVDKTKQEVEVLQEYLPKQLTQEEVENIINDAINKGFNDMGSIMKEVSPQLKGRADMRSVSELIRNKLK